MPARHRLGDLHLNILTDGVYFQDAGAVFGVVPRILWERLGIELNARHQMALGLNSMLVESQGKTVLIETGVGEKDRPLGQTERPGGVGLLEDLAALGVAPENVDVVINTHLHADHCGWNTKKQGDAWIKAQADAAIAEVRSLIRQVARIKYAIVLGQVWFSGFEYGEAKTSITIDSVSIPCEATLKDVEMSCDIVQMGGGWHYRVSATTLFSEQ